MPVEQWVCRCLPIFATSPALIGPAATSALPPGYAPTRPSTPLRSEPTGHRNRAALEAPSIGLGPRVVATVEPAVPQKSLKKYSKMRWA